MNQGLVVCRGQPETGRRQPAEKWLSLGWMFFDRLIEICFFFAVSVFFGFLSRSC